MVQAGHFTEVNLLNIIDSGKQFEMISAQVKASRNLFIKSMEPQFYEVDNVLIDPAIYHNLGDFVVALNEHNEAAFKKYKQLAKTSPNGEWYFELIPLNNILPKLTSLE